MEDNSAFKYGKEKSVGSVFMQMIFSHFGLLIIVGLYAVIGAKLFIAIEIGAEEERYKTKQGKAFDVDQTIDYTANTFWWYGDDQAFNWTYKNYSVKIQKNLDDLEEFILDAISTSDYDGTVNGWAWDWTFMNALLLCITIMTTIGYGSVTPSTQEGQIFCIIYALIGCPLFLVFLASLGDSMANGFVYIYSRCCCRSCRSRRHLSDLPDNVSKRFAKHVIDDEVGEEEYMPTSKMFVPITINIVLLHMYFLLGGVMFSIWEGWGTTASVYFSFITLSTIGYGDYVPGKTLTDTPESAGTTMKLLITLLYILLGMALLSMCINLMQEQIVEKCRWAARELGLSSTDEVSTPKPVDKRKDSLMPLMESKTGPSPFRSSDSPSSALAKPDRSKLPGILEGGD